MTRSKSYPNLSSSKAPDIKDTFLSVPPASIMPHTIGLIGHNGNVGSAVLAALLPAHKSGSIKLAILHRPSSSTSNIPSDVEKRVIDLEKKDVGALKSAVAGINILM
jgi:hypothetical protein